MTFQRGTILKADDLEARFASIAASRGGELFVDYDIGVPATQTVSGDQTALLQTRLDQAAAEGYSGYVTRGRAVQILGVVNVPENFIISNGVGGDTRDDLNGSPAYRQLPRWEFGPSGKLYCDGAAGAIIVRDFLALSTAWEKVAAGTNPDLDNTAMRAALTHQLQGYAGTCIEMRGDGCQVENACILGFQFPINMSRGARQIINGCILDAGGNMTTVGAAITLNNSGGACRFGRIHSITCGIKNVRGIAGFDWIITGAANDGGNTKLTIGAATFLKFQKWKSGKFIKKNDEIIYLVSGTTYHQYKARAEGSMGTIPPTHTSGTTTYDGVPWQYIGVYTGIRFNADRPSGFLLPGDRVILNVSPTLIPTANAEAEFDLRYRGHYGVVSMGSQSTSAAEWTIDLPWNASYATSLVGGYFSIYPGMRIAWGLVTDESDGLRFDSFQNKGPLGAAYILASNGHLSHMSCEESAEGEYARGNQNSIGYY
ncbi:MAG: hypothetical protein KGR68_09150, partial [Betaproteobacteria bacterium]|nr:hypothetical protein [Betaproteobacteria bacterium]